MKCYVTLIVSCQVCALMFGLTSRIAFGRKSKRQERYILIAEEILRLGNGFSLVDLYPSLFFLFSGWGAAAAIRNLHKESDCILQSILEDHRDPRASPTNDLVDILLNLQNETGLDDQSIKSVITDIFIGGSDTSAMTIEWAMAEMMENPEAMEKAVAEVRHVFKDKGNVDETGMNQLVYLKAVIKETLRLHPPGSFIPRENDKRCTVMGYEIPPRSRVLVNLWAIGRDPKLWKEPERFDPQRFLTPSMDQKGFDFKYNPFGAGRRACPGSGFANASMELVLAQLLYHFDWKLPIGVNKLNMEETFGFVVTKKDPLVLVPTLHVFPVT